MAHGGELAHRLAELVELVALILQRARERVITQVLEPVRADLDRKLVSHRFLV